MQIELDILTAYCATNQFTINGVCANESDFGSSYDASPETAEDYACGNRVFERHDPTAEVLAKYAINEAEYGIVAAMLEAQLSFGKCGWCV
jgi:hypothetical protein